MSKRLTSWIVGGIGLVVFVVMFIVAGPHVVNLLSREKFDPELWKRGGSTEATLQVRLHMVHDLIDNYSLTGMKRREVERLLGTPDGEYPERLSYDLGPTGSGIDHGTLTLKMKDGIVVEYSVSSH